MMKYLIVAAALAGLISTAALGEQRNCRTQAGTKEAQAACKKKPMRKPQATDSGSGLSAADREALDRAHTRTLLEDLRRR
jgi:hypothetical protein